MAVISSPKVSTVLSGKDLKPWISNAFKYKGLHLAAYSLLNKLLYQGMKRVVNTLLQKWAGRPGAPRLPQPVCPAYL